MLQIFQQSHSAELMLLPDLTVCFLCLPSVFSDHVLTVLNHIW